MKRICRRQSSKIKPKKLDQIPKYDLQIKFFVFYVKILSFNPKALRAVFLNRLQALVY